MLPFIFSLLMIWAIMWAIFKFMYPKPPKAFMPKEGDVLTPRECDYCGYPLAEYRGVIEIKPDDMLSNQTQDDINALKEAVDSYEKISLEETGLRSKSRMEKKQFRLAQEQRLKEHLDQQMRLKKLTSWFFCNYEHQEKFHEEKDISRAG